MSPELLDLSGELAEALARPAVTMSGLLPGLHRGIEHNAYHYRELGVVSHTAAEELRRSAAHYLAWVSGKERPPTAALNLGSAAHMRALEPARFAKTYVIAPDFGDCRYKAAKDARDAWRLEHKGATILDSASGHATLGMVEAIAEHPIARPLLEGGEAELTLRWDALTTGLHCKARTDFYRSDLCTTVDLKSAADASRDAFRRSVATFGYHRQQAHYEHGFDALDAPLDHFLFIVVEKHPPFAVAVYELDEADVALGGRQMLAAMRTLRDCLDRNVWPGYPDTIQRLSLPPWMKDDR